MFCGGKKSGLSRAAAAVVIVIVISAAGVGAIFATTNTRTTTVTQTITQSATVTTTVTSLRTPTANNTIDLRANSTVVLAVVGSGGTVSGAFLVGTLINPTIKIKAGTSIQIFFLSVVVQGVVRHSFVIVNSKPPFPFYLSQSDVTPAFAGASTDNPIHPQKEQFTLFFTADKPGTYYYISAVDAHANGGMYGQFIVEE